MSSGPACLGARPGTCQGGTWARAFPSLWLWSASVEWGPLQCCGLGSESRSGPMNSTWVSTRPCSLGHASCCHREGAQRGFCECPLTLAPTRSPFHPCTENHRDDWLRLRRQGVGDLRETAPGASASLPAFGCHHPPLVGAFIPGGGWRAVRTRCPSFKKPHQGAAEVSWLQDFSQGDTGWFPERGRGGEAILDFPWGGGRGPRW